VDLVAEMSVYNPFDFFLEPEAERVPLCLRPRWRTSWRPTWPPGRLTPRFKAYLDSIARAKQRTIDFLVGLNQRLQQDIAT
jgi:hypothetical protein